MDSYSGRIVAAGGGGNGSIPAEGVQKPPIELAEADAEIIRLTEKKHPHVLVLPHAQIRRGPEMEKLAAGAVQSTFEEMFGCESRRLASSDVTDDPVRTGEFLKWADIIYVGGGHTPAMMDFWLSTGFGDLLRKEWRSGKVMCGASAGAICWFASGNTDIPGYVDREVNSVPGLGLVRAYISPHCQSGWKRESEIRSIRHLGMVGLSVSNCSAVVIADGGFRIIKSTPADPDFRPYVLRSFWKDGELFEEELEETEGFRPLESLLEFRMVSE